MTTVVELEEGNRAERGIVRSGLDLPETHPSRVPEKNRLKVEEKLRLPPDVDGLALRKLVRLPALVPLFHQLTADRSRAIRMTFIDLPSDLGKASVCASLVSRSSRMNNKSLRHPNLPETSLS